MGLWYDAQRDGTIEDYIEYCRNERLPKCFRGPEQFQRLVDLGYITPDITSIRIMYNFGRGDEFYSVVRGFKLEGADVLVHSGKQGIHDPRELLSGDVPHFEIDNLNPHPEPRESIK
ncbi:hypothetical protein CMI42_02680 [Candidatus Pacearchaeota archaeon]|nr:hypothetical protein [Candidatus Pacearchaeota archaeon]